MKKIIPFVGVALIVGGAVFYFDFWKKAGFGSDVIGGSGTIEVTEIEVSSRIAGRVVALPFEEGDRVKSGDIVARLSIDELDAQRLSALASLDNAARNLTRARQLFASGSVSRRDLDNAETAYRVAQGNAEYIRASIGESVLRAPIDGVILERTLEIGETAFPGTPVLVIGDLSRPWIRIYIPETMLGKVTAGQKAQVYIDSYPERSFEGHVVSVSDRAEFTPKTIQTREERVKLVYGIKIAIVNENDILKPGMPADAEIAKGEKQ